MGHEALIQHLIRNAEAKREEILRRGREEGARLIAEAEEEGRRRARASEKAAAREIGRERRVRMNRIERERRRLLLRARSSMVEEILAPHCVEIKRNTPRNEREVVNLACLVKRERQEEFEAAVFEAAQLFDNRYAFDYNGPWPPHNFVDMALDFGPGRAPAQALV